MPSQRSPHLERWAIPFIGRRLSAPAATTALAVVAVVVWLFWPTMALEIHRGEGGPVVKTMRVNPGDRFTYTYLHSVQKRPVEEILEVTSDGRLVVRETAYDMLGVGLPSDVLDGDFVFDDENDKFRIVNMARDLPVMRVRVAFTAEQTLKVGSEEFRLDSLATPMTLLVIEAASRPRVAAWLSLGA
ncbi:MAG: DUF1850 domain-containing protein [Sphingomonadaceae bacterium]